VFVLDLDQPSTTAFTEPQQVEVRLGTVVVDSFALPGGKRDVRRIPISAAVAGTDATLRFTLAVDRTFVPSKLATGGSADNLELGVRVFDARIESGAP
jgi:hypothetical protein